MTRDPVERIVVQRDTDGSWFWTAYRDDVKVGAGGVDDGPGVKARALRAAMDLGAIRGERCDVDVEVRTQAEGLELEAR